MSKIHDFRSGRKPQPVRRSDGRAVGVVVGDEYRRTLRPEHVLQTPPAIAADVEVLAQAEALGAVVGVWTLPDGSTATLSLAEFRRRGFPLNRGFGDQLAVPLSAFSRVRVGTPGAAQLALFDGR